MPMFVLKVFANRIMDANIYGANAGDDDALTSYLLKKGLTF